MIFQCGGEKFPKRHDKEGMNTITQRDEPRVLPHTIERSIGIFRVMWQDSSGHAEKATNDNISAKRNKSHE